MKTSEVSEEYCAHSATCWIVTDGFDCQ